MNRVERIIEYFKSGAPTYVKILESALDIELEPGMIAKVDYYNKEELYYFELLVTPGLQKINKPLEVRAFFNKKTGAYDLTYLEHSNVKPGESYKVVMYDCDNKKDCSPTIELYKPSSYFIEYLKVPIRESYVEFLEAKLYTAEKHKKILKQLINEKHT